MADKNDWAADLNPFSGCTTGCTVFVLIASFFFGVIIAVITKL